MIVKQFEWSDGEDYNKATVEAITDNGLPALKFKVNDVEEITRYRNEIDRREAVRDFTITKAEVILASKVLMKGIMTILNNPEVSFNCGK